MKIRNFYSIICGALVSFGATAQVDLHHVTTYHTGIFDEGAAEIVTYDEGSQKLFFSNADDNSVGVLDFSDPTSLSLLTTIDISLYGDGVNSVAAYDGVIAVAVEIDEEPGLVVFFDDEGNQLSQVEVGFLPDMVTFTHDGNMAVVACEGEPSDDWLMDPAGSVGIIDVSGGAENVTQGDVTLTEIGSYTGSFDGVRIFPESLYWIEDFQDTTLMLNEFVTYNELSSGTWYYDDFSDDYFAEANGYGDDTNSIDWLISPVADFSAYDEVYVSFENTKNFSGGSLDFLISSDYDGLGDPTTATWDTLTSMVAWSTGGYQDTNSGEIDITSYAAQGPGAVAFLYQTTGNGGGDGALWQIDDVKTTGYISTTNNLEPEYVTISEDNSTAYICLQENNAIAVINLNTGEVSDMLPLGSKDHSIAGNGLDASDKDDMINITTHPFHGLYQPDAITSVSIDGTTYLLTANEGDGRDYDKYSEEERLKDVTLDASAFPNAAILQEDSIAGRINITTSMGDTDGDGDFDEIYTYGARSFTIWNTNGSMVYDSGDEFEQETAAAFPDDFNSGNDENQDFEGRSDNKGPEPEAIEVANVGDNYYAFIGLERIGGVMMYDITDPANASFVTYVNNRDFSVVDVTTDSVGDLGCEDVTFIDSAASPDGNFYIVTANEVSGTVSVFEVTGLVGTSEVPSEVDWTIYPNPATEALKISQKGNYTVVDVTGRTMIKLTNRASVDVRNFQSGVYFISDEQGEVRSFIVE